MAGSILDQIVETKRQEIEAAKTARPVQSLVDQLESAPPVRNFLGALSVHGPIKLISEVKKTSPSKGLIREDFDPLKIARCYQQHGATCLSVLTDEHYFQGSLQYLSEIRQSVNLPVLRKDFVLDCYQVVEARVAGADAVLLIAECLDDDQLQVLHDQVVDLGMTPLVEFYEQQNLQRVIDIGAQLIGVNNRNLQTFETDLNHVIQLRSQIPQDRLLVGESGIHGHEDAQRLANAGIDAMLVGEHLMAAEDIGAAVNQLLGGSPRGD
ncbi:MAG: indole-3-glycerol phosphate synthase TrpC [Planctomycetaceae bacterium]|nr:indole-3-glycerol phosphate synthase TrpC [Planctomycetaceae bacterium]